MKKRIQLKRIYHRDRSRLALFFDYDEKIKSKVKTIDNIAFSRTHKCFYLDDTEENLTLVLQKLKDIAEVDISALALPSEIKKFYLTVEDDNGSISVPEDIEGLSGIPDQQDTPSIVSGATHQHVNFDPVSFSINEPDGRLIIKFLGMYDQDWIKELKSYGRLFYDPYRKEWYLRWSQITVDSLADYFTERGIKVKVEKAGISGQEKEKRAGRGSEVRERMLGVAAMEGIENVRRYLNENRYSSNTTEAYLALLQLFLKYYNDRSPSEITEHDISDFFNDYVFANKYSESYHNQIISAIKLYYTLNVGCRVNVLNLGRPRRSRSLPKVFSKEEVKRILSSTNNIKHRLLLWMIYSCGLRRSEVINIRLSDLDRERGILNIIKGKGMVDRIVPVSTKVWDKIDEYIESYRPLIYLFQGQSGSRYSSESVYRVFKEALRKSGIRKDVGVHALRHSYATHLHESGLDIRYIQELLGHRSTRTTEIYTHVSRRNLVAVRSPIEDLDLK